MQTGKLWFNSYCSP